MMLVRVLPYTGFRYIIPLSRRRGGGKCKILNGVRKMINSLIHIIYFSLNRSVVFLIMKTKCPRCGGSFFTVVAVTNFFWALRPQLACTNARLERYILIIIILSN